jgi:hypothetical protein
MEASCVMSDAPDFKLLLKVEVKRGSIARYLLVLMASIVGLLVTMLIPIAWWWMFHG